MADTQPARPASRGSQKRTRSQTSNDVRVPSFPSDRTSSSTSTSTETSLQPQQQASQIEKSVTHLLVATKQLLETLTQWSRGAATETEVSDVYVRLGYEFNIACRSFISVGIDTTDLGPVPDTLRSILEDTLAQEASQTSLDRYLPRIRDIIINLLHGLKRKQQKLRAKTGRDGVTAGVPARQGSIASTAASIADDDASSRQSSRTSYLTQRGDSRQGQYAPQLPPVDTSASNGRMSPAKEPDFSVLNRQSSSSTTSTRNQQTQSQAPLPAQPSSTQTASPPLPPPSQSQPPAPPYPATDTASHPNPDSPIVQNATLKPPGEQDALAALQRGGELERRASRRFSQYQIQKHLGTSSIGMPSMPAQMSPIPNRGRDAHESAQMSRMRSSHMHNRSKSKTNLNGEPSPNRLNGTPGSAAKLEQQAAGQVATDPTKLNRAQSTRSALSPIADSPSKSRMSATITQFTDFETPPSYMPVGESPLRETPPQTPVDKKTQAVDNPEADEVAAKAQVPASEPAVIESTVPEPAPLEPEHVEPAPTYEVATAADKATNDGPLTLFLQYKKRVKKFVLSDGYSGLSLARLQLAFIEKFAWNSHGNGVDLPEIYLQDAESGVRHELEDLNDVKDYSILVLNVDDLDEVKRHFDDGFGGLKSVMEAVKSAVGDQQMALQRVSDRQQEAAAEMARIAVAPARSSASAKTGPFQQAATNPASKGTPSQLQEVQALRRELAVMRQTYSSNIADMETSMSALRAKADAVAKAAVAASSSSMSGDSGRAYVDRSKNQLSEDSEKIINRVDDLQDIVEELRKDVVTRGVRPLPRQLESVSKDVQQATAELRKLRDLIKREKPIWTKVGENELKAVCDDQNVLTLQEELAADLEDDLEKAAQTFALVEQATKQQNLQGGPGQSTSRQASRTLVNGEPVDPLKAKDGVLGEVRALQPNHETRLEAIERAEKARQLELENRRDGEFQREIRNYVQQGMLKKSGGIEEAERMRKNKDEEDRRAIWERLGGKSVYQDPEMEAEAEAKRAEMMAKQQQEQTTPSLDVPSAPSADDASLASPAEEFVEASEAPLPTTNDEKQEPSAT